MGDQSAARFHAGDFGNVGGDCLGLFEEHAEGEEEEEEGDYAEYHYYDGVVGIAVGWMIVYVVVVGGIGCGGAGAVGGGCDVVFAADDAY
mmetsp:Transcript_28951/g.52925  ORF Transcript_28951/g.52925 Transcript_28951/m.52925 type:complete len:90 (+) Transcript_28951:322-591(+)